MCLQIFTDPVFYLMVYALNRFKVKKQFYMVPVVHDIIQAQALVWVSWLTHISISNYYQLYVMVVVH